MVEKLCFKVKNSVFSDKNSVFRQNSVFQQKHSFSHKNSVSQSEKHCSLGTVAPKNNLLAGLPISRLNTQLSALFC